MRSALQTPTAPQSCYLGKSVENSIPLHHRKEVLRLSIFLCYLPFSLILSLVSCAAGPKPEPETVAGLKRILRVAILVVLMSLVACRNDPDVWPHTEHFVTPLPTDFVKPTDLPTHTPFPTLMSAPLPGSLYWNADYGWSIAVPPDWKVQTSKSDQNAGGVQVTVFVSPDRLALVEVAVYDYAMQDPWVWLNRHWDRLRGTSSELINLTDNPMMPADDPDRAIVEYRRIPVEPFYRPELDWCTYYAKEHIWVVNGRTYWQTYAGCQNERDGTPAYLQQLEYALYTFGPS